MSSNDYFLGIDIGTQGLTVLVTDRDLHVVAAADATYGFVTPISSSSNNEDGCYEQTTDDWERALDTACRAVAQQLASLAAATKHSSLRLCAIGISGQMHGEVLLSDEHDGTTVLNPVRLWCDGRNAAEAAELTRVLATKCPQRMTAVRFLWTARQQPARAAATRRLTTPAGWLAWRLTGQVVLGVGDAAGMFPVTSSEEEDGTVHHQYDAEKLALYNELLHKTTSFADNNNNQPKLQDLLPDICVAGQDAGRVTAEGARSLLSGLIRNGDDSSSYSLTMDQLVGVPVASAEGDQVAALAGSLVGQAGTVACSFGTSVCANVVASSSTPFQGVSPAIDHFCAADGQQIHMVWLRNGTTFFNTTVAAFTQPHESTADAFARLMPEVLQAPPDCGGLLAMPFMDDEPGLGVATGPSTALTLGWTATTTPAQVILSALLSTMWNLKAGVQVLVDQQVVELKQIVLSGGLVKTPGLGQVVANVFDCPVRLLAAADEGSSWGAAVMADYGYECLELSSSTSEQPQQRSWSAFLKDLEEHRPTPIQFTPQPDVVQVYQRVYAKYEKLRALEGTLRDLQRDE